MHPLAAASRSRLLCSKRPIMRSALNVSLRKTWMSDIALNQSINQSINQLFYLQTHNLNKGDISRLQTNLKLTVLSNTKLRHLCLGAQLTICARLWVEHRDMLENRL